MMKPHKRRKVFSIISPRAFTLLELILGLVIFSLVSLSLFQIFSNGVETYRRTQFAATMNLQMFRVFDLLDSDVASALKFDYSAKDSAWQSFQGDSSSIRFVRRTKDGLKIVHYAMSENNHKNFLKRQEEDLGNVLQHKDFQNQSIVARNIIPEKGFEVLYGQQSQLSDDAKNKLDWKNEWHDVNLPSAIKIVLRCVPYQEAQGHIEFSRIFYLENH